MKKIFLFSLTLLLLTTGCILFAIPYVVQLDKRITDRFEGRRWELPARIYARPLELYVGKQLTPDNLATELTQLRYSRKAQPGKPGEYSVQGDSFHIYSRSFPFPDGMQPATVVTVQLQSNEVVALSGRDSKEQHLLVRLEPVQYASIYPTHNEDRLLLKLQNVPELLIRTLLLVEDDKFYDHWGIRPTAILRAGLANIKAGRTVQGGSTLTQQLVKNLFLTSEQTLVRKLNEAIMALLLEYHYSKDEILEAYLNEVYLGQDGKRAIHGFGIAAKFYYGRNLAELEPVQIALLVGIVKGASYFNPRQHHERAVSRRNKVLDIVAAAETGRKDAIQQLKSLPLTVTELIPSGITPYPAFLQLVRRQLERDYKEDDLRSEGLSIFTTLDPIIQKQAEQSLSTKLTEIEERKGGEYNNTLQGALVLASVDQGEVVAVVGDRIPHQAGFNRALDMKRPIGSVIKPAVYLTALSRPESYNLLTTIYDLPLTVSGDRDNWQPENYDHISHGPIPLMMGLVRSYNLATVQLGMQLGIDGIINTLHGLGIQDDIAPYPSLLLGAIDLPPLDVLQMYQTLAAGGYKTPLRAILAVTDQQNNTLQRYPLTVEQSVDPGAVTCLLTAMQAVVTNGTAQSLQYVLPSELTVAGKTGTTNELRDSWFAGFSGSHVGVAWVGRDDNKPTGLTGSTGGLLLWGDVMAKIDTSPLQTVSPETIDYYYADMLTGKILGEGCDRKSGVVLPFIRGGLLPEVTDCSWQRGLNFLR